MTYVFSFLCTHVCTILHEHVKIFLKCVDWFNHHFGLSADLLSSLWCIFTRVFPSKTRTIIDFQGMQSPHAQCIRNSHAPSFPCCSCHTLATNKDILLASMQNQGQGIIIWPTAGTPTPNGMRFNWDFLLGRSPYILVGLAPSTHCYSYSSSFFKRG